MAKLKTELDKYISLSEKEYFSLIEDQIILTALKAAGVEELPMYKSVACLLENNRIEIHLKPIKNCYK